MKVEKTYKVNTQQFESGELVLTPYGTSKRGGTFCVESLVNQVSNLASIKSCYTINDPHPKGSLLTGMRMSVKDAEGNNAQLTLYSYPSLFDARQDDLDTLLPLGTILLIREPTYITTFSFSKTVIRV